MNKKLISFLIAAPALFLLFFFKLFPAFCSILLSVKNYSPFKGLMGSPSVGTTNYAKLFQTNAFPNILSNSITLSLISILLTCVLALVLIICVSKMPNKWWKLLSIIILSIPAFIPITSFVGVIVKVLSPTSGFINKILSSWGNEPIFFMTQPSYYPLIFSVMDSLRNVYIPVIIGVLICEKDKNINMNKLALVLTGYIAVRLTTLLSPDFETILTSYNPLLYQKADVLDTYMYRTNMMESQFGLGSAIWIIKTLAQLVINFAIYIVFSKFIPKISLPVDKLGDNINKGLSSILSIVGYMLFALGSIAIIILTFSPLTNGFFDEVKRLLANREFITSFMNTLLYSVVIALIYGFISVTLAYPLTVKSKLYPIFLVFILSLTNNIVSEYLMIKSMRLINTFLPVVIGSSLTVIGAFALHFTINNRFKDSIPSFREYVRASILPLAVIVTLAFISSWGSYFYQYAYINKKSLYGIGMLGMQLLTKPDISGGLVMRYPIEATRSAFIFLTSIIPVTLGTVLICLNKHLPLSAFGAQIRKG